MEIKDVPETTTLAVNLTVPASGLPEAIGKTYAQIGAFMEAKGIPMTGAPYVLYRNMDMDALDIEIGFPAAPESEGEGDIRPSVIPAGRVVTTIHLGPYGELEKTYTKVSEFAAQRNITLSPWMYESYLNSPEDTPPEELQTQLYFPIQG